MSGAAVAGAYAPQAVTQLVAGSFSDLNYDPADALCEIELDTNGILSISGTSGTSYYYLTGDAASNWEVRFTATTGTVSGGTTGVWLALTSARKVWVSQTSVGSKTCGVTVEIGRVGTSTAVTSALMNITAQVDL